MTTPKAPLELWIAHGSHADIVCYTEKDADDLAWQKGYTRVIEHSAYQELQSKLEIAKKALESTLFALQCMIIKTNQQVFDGVIEAREKAREALKEIEK